MKLSRKQAKESLETIPMVEILGKSVSSELTHKQREFARQVALGQTKANAYRKAYKQDASKRTLACKPYELMRDERIKREIEAYELAIESAKYRSPAALRELVIQSLVQTVIDPEAKHSVRVSAAKVLGTVTEVSAFTERKEITHISSSDDARDQIMSVLTQMVRDQAIDVDPTTLIQELEGTHPSPTPQDAETESPSHVHTIPHDLSQPQDTPTPSQNSDPDSNK